MKVQPKSFTATTDSITGRLRTRPPGFVSVIVEPFSSGCFVDTFLSHDMFLIDFSCKFTVFKNYAALLYCSYNKIL